MHASFGKLCYSFRTGFRIFTGVCKECYPSSQSGLYAGLCSLHPSLTFGLLPRTGLDQHTSVEYSSDILYIGKTYLGYSTPAIAFTVYSSLYKSVTDYEQRLWPSALRASPPLSWCGCCLPWQFHTQLPSIPRAESRQVNNAVPERFYLYLPMRYHTVPPTIR